ncbi:hypothetical protein CQA53_01915 [Helicobacter didelphidarum]|uniref:Uncharacterized protein n=1 Tax=Helicobacter didelphidarum TaxID=2040648 RepID=A0A3D8IR06_9HELI|nr:hypothetical protein [Helicobacter didelphidarum]RDU67041.1 hypothetical protein CQA53_01915 [Helicobacter didelphidarum]
MNKKVTGIIGGIIVAIALGLIVYRCSQDNTQDVRLPMPEATQETSSVSDNQFDNVTTQVALNESEVNSQQLVLDESKNQKSQQNNIENQLKKDSVMQEQKDRENVQQNIKKQETKSQQTTNNERQYSQKNINQNIVDSQGVIQTNATKQEKRDVPRQDEIKKDSNKKENNPKQGNRHSGMKATNGEHKKEEKQQVTQVVKTEKQQELIQDSNQQKNKKKEANRATESSGSKDSQQDNRVATKDRATYQNTYDDKQKNKETTKHRLDNSDKQQDSYVRNVIAQKEEQENGLCEVAPVCNNLNISKSLAAASLQSHALVRAEEERVARGERAKQDFLRLWGQTRSTILPKLTSHVSNIKEYGLSTDKKQRTCNASYYTEVLEDFGHGWKDKKGDKSPIYSVVYRVSCKNDKPTIGIIAESIQQSNSDYATFHAQMKKQQSMKESVKEPPLCDALVVHEQIAKASFEYHALIRSQEEGRVRGREAQTRFMNLWQETQDFVISKLTAHISQIRAQGRDSKTGSRRCVANYYTEVLEDFGHGWKDKKGDKSPQYIIYYNVGYMGNDEDSLEVKITSQNRTGK